ncbi:MULTISPECIES: hypothetical protein [Rhizobium]|uniref:Uncharacterized protein n=1 Tax=Rhizobium favelukesii TaxID=348824 RepID=W6R7E3_9HYPH|nr:MULTISPECIES: hypothetical protein [Rhizobium]MCS0462918.1 hypothetical protein [Rhizobium favelukesii]UFS82007.1 hypothetical protein LPB79_27620 [Rhizobium sp. T136]CDM56315.1 hypothetical protein LPU83_0633 [Rhizobium favelukesii]
MKPNEPLDPSDLVYELGDLEQLLRAIYDVMHEMDYVRQDGSRIVELDKVASLQRIACTHAAMLVAASSKFDRVTCYASGEEGRC